jgi:hypothetical protein
MAEGTVCGFEIRAHDSGSDPILVAATLRADRVQRLKLAGLDWGEVAHQVCSISF